MKELKRKILAFTIVCLPVLSSLCITGCASNSYSSKEETKRTEIVSPAIETISSALPGEDIPEKILENNSNINKSVSSGYYLSLGVLDENFVLNETGRNKSEITVANKNIIFPQGEIKSISIKSWSRKEKPYNPPQSETAKYIDALENSEIIYSVPEKALTNMVKIETHILYLNSQEEFRTINVINLGNGYHEISVEKDDIKNFAKNIPIQTDTEKKYKQVFLRSKEAEKIIKKWINWEDQGKDGFRSIQSASMSVDGNVAEAVFTEKQLKKLKTYLKSDKKTAEAPCGHENYFECIQKDGSRFHFSISADGESISTDKEVYVVNYPDNVKITKLFKEIYKSAKK